MFFTCLDTTCKGNRNPLPLEAAKKQGMSCGHCSEDLVEAGIGEPQAPIGSAQQSSTVSTPSPTVSSSGSGAYCTDEKEPTQRADENVPPKFIHFKLSYPANGLFATKNIVVELTPNQFDGFTVKNVVKTNATLSGKPLTITLDNQIITASGCLPDNGGFHSLHIRFSVPSPNGSELWQFGYHKTLTVHDEDTDKRTHSNTSNIFNVSNSAGDGGVNSTNWDIENKTTEQKIDYSLHNIEAIFKHNETILLPTPATATTHPVVGFSLRPGLAGTAVTHVRLLDSSLTFGRIDGIADLFLDTAFSDVAFRARTNRMISGKHVELAFKDNQFFMKDLSSGGSTFNDRTFQSVSTNKTIALKQGDNVGFPHPSRIYLNCQSINEGLLLAPTDFAELDKDLTQSYLMIPPTNNAKGWVRCSQGSLFLGPDLGVSVGLQGKMLSAVKGRAVAMPFENGTQLVVEGRKFDVEGVLVRD